MSEMQNEAIQGNHYKSERAKNRNRSVIRFPLWIYSLLVLSLIWEVFARWKSGSFLPPLSKVLVAGWRMLLDGSLLSALMISLQALVIGFVLAVVIGILLGLAMGSKPLLDKAFVLYMDILTAIPMVSIIPLIVVFFGLDLTARIVVVFLFSVVIVVENTRTGVRQVDAQLLEMARSFGASRRQITRKILLPTAIPFMASGIRLSLGRAIVGMVTAEMILSSVGIGNLLMQATTSFESSKVFAIVLSLLILSAVLISIIQGLENYVLRHRR